MPQLRAPDGSIVNVPDEQAGQLIAGGYQLVSIAEAGAVTAAPERETSGALAPIGAAASSFLSGASLGLSDLAFKSMFNKGSYERLAADREAHPIISAGGQLAGAFVGGPTPAGTLGRATGALAGGAGGGIVARVAASGLEGSVYNAGAYLSDSALGDREVSAEGLRASLGPGFEFGAAGGLAALGIEKGTIAARRMFSRLADGTERAANEAEQAWRAKYQSTIEANDAAADAARGRLAEAQLARQHAQLAQQRAAAGLADARAELGGEPGHAPGQTAGAGEAPPGGPASASGAPPTASPAGSEPLPPHVEAAGLLRDRASAITDTQVQAWDAAHGARLRELQGAAHGGLPPALQALADRTGVVTRGPAAVANEAELAAALREHDAARADLDDLLQRLEVPGVQSPARPPGSVPVGEFGAPGARGVKSPEELAAKAAGEGSEPRFAGGTPGGDQPVTRVLRGPGGPPVEAEIPASAPADEGTAVGRRGPGIETTPAEQTPSRIPGTTADRVEVKKVGNWRDRKMEVVEYHNGVAGEPRTVSQDEAYEIAKRSTPAGFTGHLLDSRSNFTIAAGIPKAPSEIVDNAIYVVKPSELAERGVLGNKIRPDDLKRGAEGFADASVKFPTVEIDMAPNGEMWVNDGNHRVQNAAATDRPMAVKFRAVDMTRAEKNAAGLVAKTGDPDVDISDRIRGALPKGKVVAAATETLTGQLRGTASKLGAGENVVEMGAPARAAYRGAKAERTAAAAEHFRGKARAARAAAAEPADLEMLLGGSKAALEGGASMRDMAEVARRTGGHPLDIKRLEMAHDAALERAATAAEPAERAAATQEAHAIERELTAVGAHPGTVEDVAAAAPVVTRYERAAAKLTEALGEEAPPAAKEAAQAFRAAEDAAEQKTASRATRAIDDHVTAARAGGPVPTSAADWNAERMKRGLGDALAKPPAAGASPRTAAAEADKLRADAALAHARAAETEARIGSTTAKRTADEYRAAAEAARPAAPGPAQPSKLGSLLTVAAAAGELGVPGMPHPKDIPVIGPLLSLWTKYRIAKAMMGRFAGRVAATGDARAAALAARAKDKIATAVDRTLGLAAELAPRARQPIVAAATVLGHRLIDDGEPDAKRGANAQELAAVRIREISAAATRPDLVVAMVRQQLGHVADPDLIAAAEQVLQRQFQYLAGVAPKLPPDNPYSKTKFVPSPAAAADLADRVGVLHAPDAAFRDPNPAKADALANFYPRLFAVAQQRLAERAADLEHPMDYRQQLTASLIFRVPVAMAMAPGNMAILQSAHVAVRAAMQPQPSAPPTPSVAQPTNLNQLYQTGADRRAAR